jgi:hypothetical protein
VVSDADNLITLTLAAPPGDVWEGRYEHKKVNP